MLTYLHSLNQFKIVPSYLMQKPSYSKAEKHGTKNNFYSIKIFF